MTEDEQTVDAAAVAVRDILARVQLSDAERRFVHDCAQKIMELTLAEFDKPNAEAGYTLNNLCLVLAIAYAIAPHEVWGKFVQDES